jgi:hypothetical protein
VTLAVVVVPPEEPDGEEAQPVRRKKAERQRKEEAYGALGRMCLASVRRGATGCKYNSSKLGKIYAV